MGTLTTVSAAWAYWNAPLHYGGTSLPPRTRLASDPPDYSFGLGSPKQRWNEYEQLWRMVKEQREHLAQQRQQRLEHQPGAAAAPARQQQARRRGPQQQQVVTVTMETAASSMDTIVTSGETGLGLSVAKFVQVWAPAQRKLTPAERDPMWVRLFGTEA